MCLNIGDPKQRVANFAVSHEKKANLKKDANKERRTQIGASSSKGPSRELSQAGALVIITELGLYGSAKNPTQHKDPCVHQSPLPPQTSEMHTSILVDRSHASKTVRLAGFPGRSQAAWRQKSFNTAGCGPENGSTTRTQPPPRLWLWLRGLRALRALRNLRALRGGLQGAWLPHGPPGSFLQPWQDLATGQNPFTPSENPIQSPK